MPLIKGKSQKSFVKNLKTEMEHGHPQKQSLAIAYAMKRRAMRKKMAEGGDVDPDQTGAESFQEGFRKATHYAEGGDVMEEHEEDLVDRIMRERSDSFEEEARLAGGGIAKVRVDPENVKQFANKYSQAGNIKASNRDMEYSKNPNASAPSIHKSLGKEHLQAAKEIAAEKLFAEHDRPKPKLQGLSEGGQVANQEHGENNNDLAGFDDNEFDDLVLRDDLESSYGEDDNAGDALGNAQEDADRRDLVDRIMLKNRKQRFPPGYPGR